MSYIFWKLLFQRLILAINKSFLSILRGVRFLLTLRLNIISLKKRIIGLKSVFYKQLFWDRKKVFFLNKKIYTLLRMESIFVEISVAQRPRQAVGKDPGGVVVSKCVNCPRGCGIQVVSLWYPTGISSFYLSHLTTITRSMVIWRPTTPEMIPNPSGCSS